MKVSAKIPVLYWSVLAMALITLTVGILGAILMTEAGQILALPRDWVFGYFRHKMIISLALVAVTAALLYLQWSKGAANRILVIGFVGAIAACLFFINLFAPYVWLRAQQHDAAFISVAEADRLLQPEDDILVLEINGDARAYPRDWIMVPHIAGDVVGGEDVAMTYCALSNLPQAFTTHPAGDAADYRVIAQVNNNLIFTDTQSGELYQQITGHGEYHDTRPRRYPVQRMPWASFRELYPEGLVFDSRPDVLDRLTTKLFKTSLTDHYGGDPLFPTLSMQDQRLSPQEPLWGIEVNGEHLAIPHSHFGEEDELIRTRLAGRELVIAWYAEYKTLGAFYADQNSQALSISRIDPYGNSDAGKLERVHLYPGVLWMVWSHWFPDTGVWLPGAG